MTLNSVQAHKVTRKTEIGHDSVVKLLINPDKFGYADEIAGLVEAHTIVIWQDFVFKGENLTVVMQAKWPTGKRYTWIMGNPPQV